MRKHRNRFSFQDQLTPKGGLLRSAMTFVEKHACLVRSQEPQKHFDHGAPVSMIIEELNKGHQQQSSSSFKEKIMRFIILLLVSLFAAFLWCEENNKRSPQVEEALDRYYAEISKEKQKYLAAAYKIQQKTKSVLESELKTRTQKGDLDGALGVKAVLAELEKEMVTDDPLFGHIAPGLFDSLSKVSPTNLGQYILTQIWTHQEKYVHTFSLLDQTCVLTEVGTKKVLKKASYTIADSTLVLNWGGVVDKWIYESGKFYLIRDRNQVLIPTPKEK